MWIGWITHLKKKIVSDIGKLCVVVDLIICCFSVSLAVPRGSRQFLLWELLLGLRSARFAFFTIDQMGFTGGSNLAADLTQISSAHRNFWSLICLVTTVPADLEVRTWHCGLCK